MSSIHIINRATRSNKGGGLPFYDNVDYIFSARNNSFNSDDGLWRVPNDKVPTFQIVTDENTFVSVRFRQTFGANNFVPPSNPDWFYSNATLDAAILSSAVNIDGQNKTFWYSLDSTVLAPLVPFGKWIIELVLSDGVTPKTYYSEEFTVKDCC